MDVHLSIHGRQGLAGQLYRQLRAGIVDGRLAPGERLPSTRDLATKLGVSRKTTLEAFERLIAEGYLRARAGDGTFVSHELARLAPQPMPPGPGSGPIWETLPDVLPRTAPDARPAFDFVSGVTDKTLFPFDKWRSCVGHALRLQARGQGAYRDPAGEPDLRLAVSRYLAFSRAVVSNWQDVIVTQGAQQAIDLMARVVIRPGDVVAVEDPGYPPARIAFSALGAQLACVPVDAQGLVVDALPDNARLVYVTPSHQFPLGMAMSLERRVALLEWAQRRGALVLEDDYDGEFRFAGRPMDSLKSLDNAGVVAYVGTFSKTIFPELRIGYIIPPPPLGNAMRRAKQVGDWHSCTLTQTALAKFMLDGYFAKHLRRMHKEYAARRAALLDHLDGPLAPWFAPNAPAAGIHLVAHLNRAQDEGAVIARAATASIGLYGIAGMYGGQAPVPGILFGYGGIGVADIHAGMAKLANAMAAARP
ncbi:PLP-dependent aminotransferase family protein [Cupriavidus basilensis]|uniref:PLP-dependent aminotransferase family protein n=1 Tax=Cupriavidus basilensis TaxID=68895 RepID=A0ABT6AVA2_9BURK|nr:PLP-dependent aminotransferase family protein [Cupriavidus basilensis]MDF3836550.1 PLP-dependent aminotransferase family protein [Cupriavidus basilensis]